MALSHRGRILLTGASGFVGQALLQRLRADGKLVRGVVREGELSHDCVRGPSLGRDAVWAPLLAGCDVVVHAAARAHMTTERARDPLAAFREVNTLGTLSLARQAAAQGVRRFVFISSIKVNGEATSPGAAFTERDPARPVDVYGQSKAEAEAGLRNIAEQAGMELVIIRPPLMYGPGVKANFRSMLRWLQRGVPLPFGAIEFNRRSLLALDNLADLVALCIEHPAAANQVLLACDGEDLSTTGLLRRLAEAMGVRPRLVPVPAWMLEACARALGKEKLMQRLSGNLQVDMSFTRHVLGWTPPIGVDEGLRRVVGGYKA